MPSSYPVLVEAAQIRQEIQIDRCIRRYLLFVDLLVFVRILFSIVVVSSSSIGDERYGNLFPKSRQHRSSRIS